MIVATTGDGKVAIYRWFENGEGWAYHPWYDARGIELSRAVDPILKAEPSGAFCVKALGGYLVGEHQDDLTCPDPKARDRRPTILRAAFVSRRPDGAGQDRLLDALRQVPLPDQRREDANLAVESDVCPAFAAGDSAVTRSRADALPFKVNDHRDDESAPAPEARLSRSSSAVIVASTAVFFILLALVVRSLRHHDTGHTALPGSMNDEVPQRSTEKPSLAEDAGRFPDDSHLSLDSLTAPRFRKALGAYAPVDHPYVAYLRAQAERLPETSIVYQDRSQLPALRPDLVRGLPAGRVRELSDDELAEAITGEINYERWREGPGRRDYRDRDKPLPEELRRFVERFRRPAPVFRRTAVQMAELLQTWGEPEPSPRFAEQHPFLVIDRFFGFLTRPRFVPRPLAFDHPKTAFLWRLPADPVGEGVTYDTEEELAASLQRLLVCFGRSVSLPAETPAAATLLPKIGEAMRYNDWLRNEGRRTYVDEDKDVAPDVARLVERFGTP